MQENIKSVFSEGMETIDKIGIYGGDPRCPVCGEEMRPDVTRFPRDPIYCSEYYSCPGCKNWMTRPNCGISVKRCVEHAYLVANQPLERGTKDKPSVEGVSRARMEVAPQGETHTGHENSEQCIGREKQAEDHDMLLSGRKGYVPDMSRREEVRDYFCDYFRDIREYLSKDDPHLPAWEQSRIGRLKAFALLELIVPYFLTLVYLDAYEKQNLPQPGRKGEDPEMSRQEVECDRDCYFPDDQTEDRIVITGEMLRKLKKIKAKSDLELVGWLFLMTLDWDVAQKNETQEENLSSRKKRRRDAKPDKKN